MTASIQCDQPSLPASAHRRRTGHAPAIPGDRGRRRRTRRCGLLPRRDGDARRRPRNPPAERRRPDAYWAPSGYRLRAGRTPVEPVVARSVGSVAQELDPPVEDEFTVHLPTATCGARKVIAAGGSSGVAWAGTMSA
ncbi:hypothetical protein SCOCK_300019 [Actinacidiphila cocklensis]|uniref:Uncharacterized protein n=1 Tax=Actinacidiphila cocklensis TaxID=887465 RepID=A0A9W4GS93_9ACTN|nr:hypothetical protein SCOCK_300019 [Actinacidiphila cocklensis]